MSTTARALQVLQLFREGRSRVRAVDVARHLRASSATVYRYMADLEQAGLIERVSINAYVLGPTIVELDRQIRENDPLIRAAADVMKGLAERNGGTALLCRLHGRKVVCVHQHRGRASPAALSYERGRAMPLFRGATSKVILAHLPETDLREIAAGHGAELRAAGLPPHGDGLVAAMAALRAQKVCVSAGEIDAGARGFAAAIHQGRHLLGSLSLVLSAHAPDPAPTPQRLADQVLRAALRVEGRLAATIPQHPGQPPAADRQSRR